jgi:hypothetical protein
MAGGAVVLGGVALIPLAAFATWHPKSKIKQIAEETERVRAETTRAEKAEIELLAEAVLADREREALTGPYQIWCGDTSRRVAQFSEVMSSRCRVRSFAAWASRVRRWQEDKGASATS